jgi:hypothetical protein
MTSQPDEPTLADVQREYPTWNCWRAVSGLYYARPADARPGDPAPVKGEDPLDLHDQIRRALALDSLANAGPAEPGPNVAASSRRCPCHAT